MKTVKIFLASSAELDEDKTRFDLFFSEKNKLYRKRNIDFDQRTWKDFVSSLNTERLQDRYNEYISDCDIAIFLFHTRLGKYTKEELEFAYNRFLSSNGKRPRIYIYFKETVHQDEFLTHFKAYSEETMGHFCDTYSSYDELTTKFDKQLQLLENEGFIKPDPVNTPRLIRFVSLFILLPLIIISLGFATFHYFTPGTATIRLQEKDTSPLAFAGADITLQYADKSETQHLNALKEELIFKEIHSRYFGEPVRISIHSSGYVPMDTTLELSKNMVLPIQRDNTYGLLFGAIKDEDNKPVVDAQISIGKLKTTTDESGQFQLPIPTHMQALEQRVTAFKQGYELWDFTGPVSDKVAWKIILKR